MQLLHKDIWSEISGGRPGRARRYEQNQNRGPKVPPPEPEPQEEATPVDTSDDGRLDMETMPGSGMHDWHASGVLPSNDDAVKTILRGIGEATSEGSTPDDDFSGMGV